MEEIKKQLISFSNERQVNGTRNRFEDYEDYITYQTLHGFSLEKDNKLWTEGQRQCIQDKFSKLDRGISILDVCCGDGRGLGKLKELGFQHVTGIEISDEKISIAKQINHNIIKMDICSGPFNFVEKYDIIYSSHTIEHVLNPQYTIMNLMKFLKDDGKCFIILPYPDVEAGDPNNDHRYKVHCGVMPLGLHKNDNAKTTIDVVSNMGFKVTDIGFHNYREPEVHLTITK